MASEMEFGSRMETYNGRSLELDCCFMVLRELEELFDYHILDKFHQACCFQSSPQLQQIPTNLISIFNRIQILKPVPIRLHLISISIPHAPFNSLSFSWCLRAYIFIQSTIPAIIHAKISNKKIISLHNIQCK